MEIMMHGDLRWLIISGSPSLTELQNAWQDILNEYSSLVKTEKSDTIFDVYKKITHTEWQIGFIEECIKALKIKYDEEIALLLNERGFGIVDHSGDWPTYLRSLYAIEMSAKMLIVLLNQYKAEYKSLSPETEDNITEATPMRYAKELAILSKFQGSWIVKEKITVLEYCAIVNNYLDYVKANKKEVPNGR